MAQRVTRRTLLQASLAGAAILSRPSKRYAEESAADKIRLAVLGTNSRGEYLAGAFAALDGCEVAYICDPDTRAIDKGLRAVAAHQSKTPVGVQDFRKALDDSDVDAVVIATPDHWHAPATILACKAGKHVYVEKPASHNGREGELMVEAAKKYSRHVQLGSQRRSSPCVREALARLSSGAIGKLLFARGWITSTRPSIGNGKPVPVPEYLDYSMWQGPAPEVEYRDNVVHYQWHWFWNWGTGELGNNGIHALDVCRWGLGVTYPNKVVCGGGRYFFQDDQQTPDTQLVTFDFGDRAIHWEHRTWNQRGIDGDDFGISFYGDGGSLSIVKSGFSLFDLKGKQTETVEIANNDTLHLINFLDTIRGKATLNAQIQEGVLSTGLCHYGNIAYRTGRTVRIDPANGAILDDADAARLWSREYRPGWEPTV